jgi:hypothetical protein
MAISVVQTNQGGNSAATTSFAVTFGGATAGGNLLVVIVHSRGSETVTLTDSAGNTYQQLGNYITDSGGNNTASIWYCRNALANAGTVTAAYSTSAVFHGLAIYEISGCDTALPFDVVRTNNATGTAITSGTLPLSTSTEIIIAGGEASGPPITAFGAGYTGTNWAMTGNASKFFFHEWHLVAASEAATATQTTSATWVAIAAAFSTTSINAQANVDQVTKEVLETSAPPLWVAGNSIEVLRTVSFTPTQVLVAQLSEEVLRTKIPAVRVAQLTVEVLRAVTSVATRSFARRTHRSADEPENGLPMMLHRRRFARPGAPVAPYIDDMLVMQPLTVTRKLFPALMKVAVSCG